MIGDANAHAENGDGKSPNANADGKGASKKTRGKKNNNKEVVFQKPGVFLDAIDKAGMDRRTLFPQQDEVMAARA